MWKHQLALEAMGPACDPTELNLHEVLAEPFASMSKDQFLTYLSSRTHVYYFPLSKGHDRHVVRAEEIIHNIFDLNHERHQLPENFAWHENPSQDLEWLILLHKFYFSKDLAGAYDLTGDEKYAQKWMNLISSWMNCVEVEFIDSQVTGRRLQQWVLGYHYFVPKNRSVSMTSDFIVNFIRSIQKQTTYLCKNLTLEGNHRTIELYAIFLIAVIFPELKDSGKFMRFAIHELLENMRQDLLRDGVHRELSTDYHHIVLKNYLRFRILATANNIKLPKECDAMIRKALEFSIYAHKPDGFIPAINDGDCNSYLSLLKKAYRYYPSGALEYVITQGQQGKPPHPRSHGFVESGYYILRDDWNKKPYQDGLYLFFDCASLGFGSHGHYDLLNFETAAFGNSLIVDPGRYTYSENSVENVNWRRIFKGTAYHNTVVIDGKDQIPYCCDQPIHPEPKALLKQFISCRNFDFLYGIATSHQYSVTHERKIFFALPDYWILTDRLSGEGSHHYDLHLHLSSRAQNQTYLVPDASGTLVISPNLLIAQPCATAISASIEAGFISPEYGIKYDAPIVKFSQSSTDTAYFHTVLYPFQDNPPTLTVEHIPVYSDGTLCDPSFATALKISITRDEKTVTDFFFMAHESEHKKNFHFLAIHCQCQFLFLRTDPGNQIINVQAERVKQLQMRSKSILQDPTGKGRIQYRDQLLEINTGDTQISSVLESFDSFHGWEVKAS